MESARTSDGFCVDNLSSAVNCLQNFQSPDDVSMMTSSFTPDDFSMMASSFTPDIGIQANGIYPFEPSCYSSSLDFSLHKFKNCKENGSVGQLMLQDGFLTFPEGKDLLMRGSHVLANGFGCYKDGREKSRNSFQNVINSESGYRERKKPGSGKGQWTAQEDRILIQLVEKYGLKSWTKIAHRLNGRAGKQCRERWHNHLKPDVKKDEWTEEEDMILISLHKQMGNRWTEMAKSLPGRTENSIKNHWFASKRKCSTKSLEPSSTLSNYISSLPLENERNSRSENIPSPSIPVNASQNPGTGTCPADGALPDYVIDDILEFPFGDDSTSNLHTWGSVFNDDAAFYAPPETNYTPWFDVDELNDGQGSLLWNF